MLYFWLSGQKLTQPTVSWSLLFLLVLNKVLLVQIFMHLRHYTRPVFQVSHTHSADAHYGTASLSG